MIEKYSYKDFTGQSLKGEDIPPGEIIGSCFAQEGEEMYDIFPDGMTGVTLSKCNLDNVVVPAGNTIDVSSWNRNIIVQNDLADWVCDGADKPTEPIDKKYREHNKISIDPKDIPAVKMDKYDETLLVKTA